MLRTLTIIAFLALTSAALGQDIKPRVDSTTFNLSAADTITQKVNDKVQSHQTGLAHKFDSLKSLANIQRFKDSLNIQGWAAGMRIKVTDNLSLDSLGCTRKIDSLRTLNLSTRRHKKKLDSLQNKRAVLMTEIGGKQRELQSKVSMRYDKWTASVRSKLKLDSVPGGRQALGVKLPGSNLSDKLPGELNDPLKEIGLPDTGGMPKVDGLPKSTFPEIPALNDKDFSSLGQSGDLVKAGGNLSMPSIDEIKLWDQNIPSISGIQGQVNTYTQMLKDPSKAAESAIGQIAEVNDVTKQLSQAEQLKQSNEALQLAEKMKDQETMKEEAKKLATNEAYNHFQGKEVVLQKAMDQMEKYKKKYSSLNSLSEIKKNDWLPHNSLKGKPFRERFRVGMHMGVQNLKDTLIIDFYPNASYKITGRLEMGAGAIYRIREVKSTWSMDQRNPAWGFSGFGIFKTFKSTYFRAEVDANSYLTSGTDDVLPSREWRWAFLAGMQTNFTISKSVTGNVQMLFNFDRQLKDAFPEALTMRFGVQYKLSAKRKKAGT